MRVILLKLGEAFQLDKSCCHPDTGLSSKAKDLLALQLWDYQGIFRFAQAGKNLSGRLEVRVASGSKLFNNYEATFLFTSYLASTIICTL
jgi:hypothetical protein